MMYVLRNLLLVATFVVISFSLPVIKNEHKEDSKEKPSGKNLDVVLEYERYLKEIVEALESDPEFRKKLDKAPEADIRNGRIAQELEYVNHNVRSQLDEIKRREIIRLRELASKQFELSNDIDREHLKIAGHLDHENQHSFEIDDLRKLILKTSQDLAEADRKRREEFKQYEMQKEFEKQAALKELDETNRKKYEEELKAQKEKHNKHERVHHPGNKAQLEEVWEKQDHMDKEEFDPRSFFMIHDVDGNGYWDETEVKALFIKELDKVYQSGLPEDDMRERAEEMERMREHVFEETDTNRDGLISYQEFLEQTKRDEYQKDPGWDTVDKAPQYTHEEYLQFERKRQEEVQRLIAQGLLPPHPNMPQGYYPNQQGGYQGHTNQPVHGNPNYHQQQQQQYQQNQQFQQQQQPQYQQQYQQQQQQQHHPQYQQQQQYQQPPQQHHPQYQQQQQQYKQPPQQQQHQQPPQQQQHQQPPQQQQYQPQAQYHPQQVQLNPNQIYQQVPQPPNQPIQQQQNSVPNPPPSQQQQQKLEHQQKQEHQQNNEPSQQQNNIQGRQEVPQQSLNEVPNNEISQKEDTKGQHIKSPETGSA